jgi:hypothetical protein
MRANDVDSDTSERKVLEHAAGWIDRLGRENEIRRSIAEVQIVVDACQRYALLRLVLGLDLIKPPSYLGPRALGPMAGDLGSRG